MDIRRDKQSISEARANLTELVASVRFEHRLVTLTSREKPVAGLIPPELAELVQKAGGAEAATEVLRKHLGD